MRRPSLYAPCREPDVRRPASALGLAISVVATGVAIAALSRGPAEGIPIEEERVGLAPLVLRWRLPASRRALDVDLLPEDERST